GSFIRPPAPRGVSARPDAASQPAPRRYQARVHHPVGSQATVWLAPAPRAPAIGRRSRGRRVRARTARRRCGGREMWRAATSPRPPTCFGPPERTDLLRAPDGHRWPESPWTAAAAPPSPCALAGSGEEPVLPRVERDATPRRRPRRHARGPDYLRVGYHTYRASDSRQVRALPPVRDTSAGWRRRRNRSSRCGTPPGPARLPAARFVPRPGSST